MMPFNNPGYPLINPLLSQPMLLGQMPIPRAMVSSAATSLVAPSLVQQMGVAPQPRPMLVPAGMGDPSAASPSTSNWSEHQANDGRVYYYNKVTKESVWSKPRELMTPQELAAPSVAGRGMWREYKTGEGRPYYYNLETKETTWSMPEGFVPNAGPSKSDTTVVKTEPVGTPGQVDTPKDEKGSDLDRAIAATLGLKENDAIKKIESSLVPLESTREPEIDHEQELKKRQSDRFRELLRDKYNEGKISATCSWEQAVKFIQHDPRFRILNKVSEKKQLFNAWKVQRQKEERDEKRLAIKKAKEDLEKWLSEHPKMKKGTIRYSRAADIFSSEAVWKAVVDSDRKEIFSDVIEAITKKNEETSKEARRRNIQALADILGGMNSITYRTTWAQAQRLLIENPAFANDTTLQSMDKEDALIVFEEHIRNAEKEHIKEKELEEKRNRRRERKVREAFQSFLEELHGKGELSSISFWSTLYPTISADSRFDAMLTQTGSTPLDLFKFYVEELKEQYGADRKIIKEILADKKAAVKVDTAFDELVSWVTSDERGKAVDMGNMKLCYNTLIEKAESDVREHEREQQRKKRRFESDLRNVFRDVAPPVEPTSAWEDVRPKIEKEAAFLAIEDEAERIRVFDEFVKGLAEACGHHHGSKKKKKEKKKKTHKDEDSESEGEIRKKKKKHHKDSGDEKDDKKKKRKAKKRSRSNSVASDKESPEAKKGKQGKDSDSEQSS